MIVKMKGFDFKMSMTGMHNYIKVLWHDGLKKFLIVGINAISKVNQDGSPELTEMNVVFYDEVFDDEGEADTFAREAFEEMQMEVLSGLDENQMSKAIYPDDTEHWYSGNSTMQ